MILVTTDYIEGKTLEMLGIVGGATIQSKHIGKDIGAGFKTLVGGELREIGRAAGRDRVYRVV